MSNLNQKEQKISKDLSKFGGYSLLEKIEKAQKEVIAAVRATGLAGSVTINLSYKRNGSQEVVIASKVTPKVPMLPLEAITLFADKENDLHDGNPDQMTTHDNVSEIGSSRTVNEV